MDRLKTFLSQTLVLTDEEWAMFSSLLTKAVYPKGSMLLTVGEVETHISFVESGTIRFFIPKEENDITFAFIFENELLCAYDSFLTQQPCVYTAQALSHTVLWQLSYESLQMLYNTLPKTNIFGRLFTEDIFIKKAKRELSFLTQSAEERYIDLFSQRPNVIKTIPLKQIASYIGITPQALSRIRKRIS